jgi:hypothetical protein
METREERSARLARLDPGLVALALGGGPIHAQAGGGARCRSVRDLRERRQKILTPRESSITIRTSARTVAGRCRRRRDRRLRPVGMTALTECDHPGRRRRPVQPRCSVRANATAGTLSRKHVRRHARRLRCTTAQMTDACLPLNGCHAGSRLLAERAPRGLVAACSAENPANDDERAGNPKATPTEPRTTISEGARCGAWT